LLAPTQGRIHQNTTSKTSSSHSNIDIRIVSSTCDQDIEWLRGETTIPISMCGKQGCPPPAFGEDKSCYVDSRAGFEASSYLSYIVHNYDHLPSRVMFLHGHSHTNCWHMSPSFSPIRLATSSCPADFISINYTPGSKIDRTQIIEVADRVPSSVSSLLPIQCKKTTLDCCAQFITTATAIRSNPLETYRSLLELVLTNDASAKSMEFVWHVLFSHKCEIDFMTSQADYYDKYFSCSPPPPPPPPDGDESSEA